MPTWRSLEDYSPFARVLVTYMWEQRPPLLPSQFAVAMGVRKQQVSSWLTTAVVPDPLLVVRLARQMGMPVRDLLIAAGHATADDPLFDTAGAWTYVRQQLAAALCDRQILEVAVGAGLAAADDRGSDGSDKREDVAVSAARVEQTLKSIEILERRQPVAARQRQQASSTPSVSSKLVVSEGSAPSDQSDEADEAEGDVGDRGDLAGASTAARVDLADTPGADAVPASRARNGARAD